MRKQIVLASASPSRKRLLESIGIEPVIKVSGVDEETPELLALKPSELVIALAQLNFSNNFHSPMPPVAPSKLSPVECAAD